MFNPFNKRLDELELDDLKKLIENQVKEGFYIEYKSDFPSGKKIAKSISSFANTYGGWYFIGIEDEEGTNIAKELVGFDLNEHRQPQEKIRNIVREHIQPIPNFYMKLIKIDEDRGILVIHIPESFETPHILSDGVIYRRNGEESSPIKETDRYTLDKLYQKSINFENRVKNFFYDPFGMTEAEYRSDIPFIKLYFIPKRFYEIKINEFYKNSYLDKIVDLINESEYIVDEYDITHNVPFDNITRSTNSIILRQTTNNKIGFANLTVEFFINGAAKIRIPIPSFTIDTPIDSKKECLSALHSILGDDLDYFRLVNVYAMIFPIRFTIMKYIKFLKMSKINSKILMKIELENIYRLIPYLENEFYIRYLEKYHIPACMYENKSIPDVHDPKPWMEFENGELKDLIPEIIGTVLTGLGLSAFEIEDRHFLESFGDYLINLSKQK